MQDSERGAVTRQQALALVVWPRVGRGTSPPPPRVLLHHPSEEPVSIQVVAQASAAVEMEAAVERMALQLRREGWAPARGTDSLRPGRHLSMGCLLYTSPSPRD
eukprot:14318253-Alexandrium_andersonii.AAC.1